jgi:ABC-type transport system involved in cytochrome bd biosynthesis fused ATPase/permease subunit
MLLTSAAAVSAVLCRRHQLFVDMVRQNLQDADDAAAAAALQQQQVKGTRPADLPVYGQEFLSRQ